MESGEWCRGLAVSGESVEERRGCVEETFEGTVGMGVSMGVRVVEEMGNNNEERLQGSSETAARGLPARRSLLASALARGSRQVVAGRLLLGHVPSEMLL